ncbi:MAG: nitrate reductase [Pseudohongiella sp.]|nr:nitrate reductase [Pseudohongiella sp.]MDO9521070.1 nitrate reductase [Pseudohongiella sp.]
MSESTLITLNESDVSVNPAEVKTTCAYCGVGCGFVVSEGAKKEDARELQADKDHPANKGRFCVKGSSQLDTIGLDNRLLYPRVDGRQVSWDEALDETARRLRDTIAEHGPDSVAFYVSGQLLTEDYYVANKLMKGFIGSANIDTNSRLCMSTAVAAHKRVLGSDSVPGCYEDLESADLIVITGSNMAWTHPVVYQRIMAAKAARPHMKLVVIDPRKTVTAESADLHLQLKPGTDAFLFDGLFAHLVRTAALDIEFIEQCTKGFNDVAGNSLKRSPSGRVVAERCGLPEKQVSEFFHLFAATEKTVTVFSQGINQSANGVEKASAILHCHLATGRIGKPGASPFSITGQPNAMGGREVGGLANQLAAHMDLENAQHRDIVQGFWGSVHIAQRPGLKAVDLFEAIHNGKVKFVWIMATNPVVSLPDAGRVSEALKKCECVVVSDCVADTDTLRLAHIKLPAAGWGEKDGTVTNSERCISRQRAFLPLPADVKPDWWIICRIAERLGFGKQFAYQMPADIFIEHAKLSAFKNDGSRDFDIGGLASLSHQDYNELGPTYWPIRAGQSTGSTRLFADGKFFTDDGRARFVETGLQGPVIENTLQFPLILNTGRIRDQWHTMTRTGRSAKLQQHRTEVFAEFHPEDLKKYGIQNDQLVSLISPLGRCVMRASVNAGQSPGAVFAPIHWNDCFTSAGRIDSLIPAVCDPVSGQPAFKQTAVKAEALLSEWQALLISRERLSLPANHYWNYRLLDGLHVYNIEGKEHFDLAHIKRQLTDENYKIAELTDSDSNSARVIAYNKKTVFAGLFVWPGSESGNTHKPDENWLLSEFRTQSAENKFIPVRMLALGRAVHGNVEGALICTCHQVREAAIQSAISNGCCSVETIGQCTRAGTQCGSCVPELRKLIQTAGLATQQLPFSADSQVAPDNFMQEESVC